MFRQLRIPFIDRLLQGWELLVDSLKGERHYNVLEELIKKGIEVLLQITKNRWTSSLG